MADPEKTLLDLLYFNPDLIETPDFEGFRLNQEEITEQLNLARLNNYLTLIASPTLEKRWRRLQNFLGL